MTSCTPCVIGSAHHCCVVFGCGFDCIWKQMKTCLICTWTLCLLWWLHTLCTKVHAVMFRGKKRSNFHVIHVYQRIPVVCSSTYVFERFQATQRDSSTYLPSPITTCLNLKFTIVPHIPSTSMHPVACSSLDGYYSNALRLRLWLLSQSPRTILTFYALYTNKCCRPPCLLGFLGRVFCHAQHQNPFGGEPVREVFVRQRRLFATLQFFPISIRSWLDIWSWLFQI